MPLFIVKDEDFTGHPEAVVFSGSADLHVRKKRSPEVKYEIPCSDDESITVSELASCYRSILNKAASLKCADIAIPLLGEDSEALPKEEVLNTAVSEISAFLQNSDMLVYLKVRNPAALALPETIEKKLYLSMHRQKTAEDNHSLPPVWPFIFIDGYDGYDDDDVPLLSSALTRKMNSGSKTFQERLLELIKEKNADEVTVYKNANIDRKLFSRIRCNKDYTPSKNTVLALAIALRLNLDETQDLLVRAGLALSPSITFDIIVSFFIENQIYDISKINIALFRETGQYLGERSARKSDSKKSETKETR
ncbi:MAG: macro domain-containing protein [Succinimonas sp.]|nr:macro domain-containing protein [Succinimonas sp.]